jgi:hypothetical protein
MCPFAVDDFGRPPATLLMDRLRQGIRLAASEIAIAVVIRGDKMPANCKL